MTMLQEGQVQRSYIMADRGPRPLIRGWAHFVAAAAFALASTVLITYGWMTLPALQATGVTVYGVGVVLLFGVSAMYHLYPWRSPSTVQWWRRADHATISIFIAATYTPLCVIVFEPRTAAIMLAVSWIGGLGGAALNLAWINHPRWLDVAVYVGLGWAIVPLIPTLWASAGSAVVWLLFAGGVFYTVGAIVYGARWPGRDARYYGYHEHFHTATIVAAVCHLVAIWIVATQAN